MARGIKTAVANALEVQTADIGTSAVTSVKVDFLKYGTLKVDDSVSIATGVIFSTLFTVTGINIGDAVFANIFSTPVSVGLNVVSAQVTAANVLQVKFLNSSAGTHTAELNTTIQYLVCKLV